jgi:hypothetical protein
MTLRKIVTSFGLVTMAFGIWTLDRAHTQVGVCTTSNGLGATHSGIDAKCVQTLMSYSLGFVFVASGFIIAVIAFTMIAKQERMDLHGELKAVPRTWGKREYVTTGEGLDELVDEPIDESSEAVKPALYVVKTG